MTKTKSPISQTINLMVNGFQLVRAKDKTQEVTARFQQSEHYMRCVYVCWGERGWVNK